MDIEKINEMIGVDRSKLNEENSKEIIERLEFKLAEIREKFFVNLPANFKEKEDFIDRAKSIKSLVSKFDELKTECKQMERTLAKYEQQSDENKENDLYKELEPLCVSVIQGNRLKSYVKYLAKVEEFMKSIETKIASLENKTKKTINKSDSKQLIQEAKSHNNEIDNLVDSLFETYIKFQDFVELIVESNCANFKRYSIQSLNHLDQRMRPILIKNFDWFLQILSFPNLAQVQESKTGSKSSSSQTAQQEKGESQELQVLNEHTINLFVMFIDRLIRIDFKLKDINQRGMSSTCLKDAKKKILVIDLLARPLDKRFRFHFFTNRKTNNIEKPEWYLSQILEWIKNQEPFMNKYVQPSFDKSQYLKGKSALIELSNCLVGLISEKIVLDLESLIKNPIVFSHTIDELLEFNSQYKNFTSYLASHHTSKCYTTLHVLCENDDMLEQWINLERDVCQKKVDNLFSCLNREADEKANIFSLSNKSQNELWSCNYSEIDLMKPPHCAESFVLLIKAISDRYADLPYASKKLKFFQLQVELFKDFHMRLCQIREEASTPLSRNYLGVLNTANYIIYILEEWKYNPFYSEINALLKKYDQFVRKLEMTSGKSYKREEAATSEDSILPGNEESLHLFDEHMQVVSERDDLRDKADLSGIMEKDVHVFESFILVSYSKVQVEMINTIAQTCKWEITSRSRLYKKEKWMNMPSPSEYTKPTLTQSAADMLISLKNLFNLLKESLSVFVVDSILKRITHELDTFIYEEIILQSQFNENGALQLQFDINKYLLPILNEFAYKIKIEEFFKNTRDSLILLTLKVGTGILLKGILNKALMDDAQLELNNESSKPKLVYEANKSLKDFGIIKLDIQQAKEILDLRCDFVIN